MSFYSKKSKHYDTDYYVISDLANNEIRLEQIYKTYNNKLDGNFACAVYDVLNPEVDKNKKNTLKYLAKTAYEKERERFEKAFKEINDLKSPNTLR
jgi:hypothetical protein